MFDIGFWELALIAILALVLLGPKRLPEAARAAGYWLGRARRFIATAKNELDQHMQAGDLDELRRLKEELDETRRYIHEVAGQARDDFTRTMEEAEQLENEIGGSLGNSSRSARTQKTGSRQVSKKKKSKQSSSQKRIPTSGKKRPPRKIPGKSPARKPRRKRQRKPAKNPRLDPEDDRRRPKRRGSTARRHVHVTLA